MIIFDGLNAAFVFVNCTPFLLSSHICAVPPRKFHSVSVHSRISIQVIKSWRFSAAADSVTWLTQAVMRWRQIRLTYPVKGAAAS
jgi:hypothetical protein